MNYLAELWRTLAYETDLLFLNHRSGQRRVKCGYFKEERLMELESRDGIIQILSEAGVGFKLLRRLLSL